MKILWVANTIFPDAAVHIGHAPTVFGGWMYGLAADLTKSGSVTLAVASVYSGREMRSFQIDGIQYYLLPREARPLIKKVRQLDWIKVIDEFQPDVVHIHGTEYDHGMRLMNTCPDLKYVVSIQGLVSVYHRYFLAGMSAWDVLRNITFRDLIRMNTLFHAKRDFYKRGLVEKEYIRRADTVVGRTDWDRAHTKAINPSVNYQFCNESLRSEFYSGERWSLESCRRNSILLSQASYPIKGLHQLLKAISFLKTEFPDILIEIAGDDIINSATLRERFRRGGYGRYIGSLIKKYGIQNNVKFLGLLSAEDMKAAYLRAHVFVCSSSIENSPNSLGEAQILGVPCIAAHSGGVPSLVRDGSSAIIYEFYDIELLAEYIRLVFTSVDLCRKISNSALLEAGERHDRKKNKEKIIEIYKNIHVSMA